MGHPLGEYSLWGEKGRGPVINHRYYHRENVHKNKRGGISQVNKEEKKTKEIFVYKVESKVNGGVQPTGEKSLRKHRRGKSL